MSYNAPTSAQAFLTVPAAWLKACGMGEEDKTFPVAAVKSYGPGRTFARIETGAALDWEVWVEERGATFRPDMPAPVVEEEQEEEEHDDMEGPDLSDSELFADSARGVYIPQHFAESVKRECVTGVTEEDYATLEAGPDGEWCWETWDSALNNAAITAPDGRKGYLWQDGDLWIVFPMAKG